MTNKNKTKQVKLPSKRTINLVEGFEKKTNWLLAIPGIILIVVAAGLFSKFLVADRFTQLSYAHNEVSTLQSQVDELYVRYAEIGNVSEDYGHYTFSGLDASEENYMNREAVLELIDSKVMPKATVTKWVVKENVLVLYYSCATLDGVKNIVANLEQDELVNFSIVNSAETVRDGDDGPEYVSAQVTVYLNNIPGGDF